MRKFNFGTGIFIFMALFMTAIISFVIFAHRQDVNLVHDNYYEKGVDHTLQMQKKARSSEFFNKIDISDDGNYIRIVFPAGLASIIEEGNVMFFRPSDHLKDIKQSLELRGNVFIGAKDQLIPGRYVVKINWIANSLDYEVEKQLIIK
jgi:hypothetical protein